MASAELVATVSHRAQFLFRRRRSPTKQEVSQDGDVGGGVSWGQEVLHAIDRNHQYGTCFKGSR
jgi:hypothetical protein